MSPVEANVLLTKAAVLDARMKRVNPVEQADMATAWAEVLAGVTIADGLQALILHYRSSSAPVMPGDVIRIVEGEKGDVPRIGPREAWLLARDVDPAEFDAALASGATPEAVMRRFGLRLEVTP